MGRLILEPTRFRSDTFLERRIMRLICPQTDILIDRHNFRATFSFADTILERPVLGDSHVRSHILGATQLSTDTFADRHRRVETLARHGAQVRYYTSNKTRPEPRRTKEKISRNRCAPLVPRLLLCITHSLRNTFGRHACCRMHHISYIRIACPRLTDRLPRDL